MEEEEFVMVVHRKSLLELVPFGLFEDPDTLPTFLSWDSWGPPVTRWFADDAVCGSLIFNYGQRFVQHLAIGPLPTTDELDDDELDDEDSNDTITIYDFNPWHVREVRLHKESFLAAHVSRSDDFRIDIFDRDASGLSTSVPKTQTGRSVQEAPANICSARNIFRSDIIGRLPYIRYSSSNWPNYEAVMIDEERLIGIQASSLPI